MNALRDSLRPTTLRLMHGEGQNRSVRARPLTCCRRGAVKHRYGIAAVNSIRAKGSKGKRAGTVGIVRPICPVGSRLMVSVEGADPKATSASLDLTARWSWSAQASSVPDRPPRAARARRLSDANRASSANKDAVFLRPRRGKSAQATVASEPIATWIPAFVWRRSPKGALASGTGNAGGGACAEAAFRRRASSFWILRRDPLREDEP